MQSNFDILEVFYIRYILTQYYPKLETKMNFHCVFSNFIHSASTANISIRNKIIISLSLLIFPSIFL